MKILFVSSGNKPAGIGQIVRTQGKALSDSGMEIKYFPITGKGIIGYLKHLSSLKTLIKNNNFDIVHAHYSFSAYLASLAGAKPLVVSLMGSDVNGKFISKYFIRMMCTLFRWEKTIAKSSEIKEMAGLKNTEIIPNGVDLECFKPLEKVDCLKRLGWNDSKKHILFAANPKRREKNFRLTQDAFRLMKDDSLLLHVLEEVSYEEMPLWMNAADVVVLTSLWEGSPNVIKEAMACNRLVVSTDVGDVRSLTEGIPGCFIADNNPADVADKIRQALQFEHSIGARQRIIDLGLEINETAGKIIRVYEQVLHGKKKSTL